MCHLYLHPLCCMTYSTGTRPEYPASGCVVNKQEEKDISVYVQVAGGFRPAIPADVPETVRALITVCWAQEAHDRPTAGGVNRALQVGATLCFAVWGLSFGVGALHGMHWQGFWCSLILLLVSTPHDTALCRPPPRDGCTGTVSSWHPPYTYARALETNY